MAYKNNIPQPTDNLSDSQVDLLNNFSQLDTSFNVNHYPFSNLTSNNGKHKYIEIPISAAIPAGLVASEGTFYTKTASGATQLFYTPDASGNEYQMTITIAGSFSRFGNSTNYSGSNNGGWSFLPGGLLIQYGKFTNPGGTGTVTFPVAFPSGAAPYSINISLERASNDRTFVISTSTASNFQFSISNGTGNTALHWVAIGK